MSLTISLGKNKYLRMVHISGSNEPKVFKFCQCRRNKRTKGVQSLESIEPQEPLISSMLKMAKKYLHLNT